ncbi:MAG: hypothetical protein J6Y03_03485 [Alphaproteobacteria bacterium]|nr:hypothetical protein [Alphaproteobacteria bacterium]
MLKYMMSSSGEKCPDYSGDFSVLSKVDQNNCVLETAQKYLNLCDGLDNGVLQRDKLTSKVSLPADLMAVEQGISVLCDVYACAWDKKEYNVCVDIREELKKISGFYLVKLSDAYFSAGNILLDAKGKANTEDEFESLAGKDEIKPLAQSYNSLKNIYGHWPMIEVKSDLLTFFEKVDSYSHDFDIENSIASSKKVGRSENKTDYVISSHQRTL